MVNTNTIPGGVSVNNVYDFIKNEYTTKGITHVLLVGNEMDIPVYKSNLIFGVGSDNPYGYMDSADHYAEIIVGRFSANNESHVQAQVQKTIEYEKLPNLSANWFSNCTAIGSNDAGKGDDGQYDWEHARLIADSLISYGPYKNKFEFFDGSKGGKDDSANVLKSAIFDSINLKGTSIINYTGHGIKTGLTTSSMQSYDLANLTNTNGQWPFAYIVGCSTGAFLDYDVNDSCFAESFAWQRHASNNKPVGGLISAMSTVAQWWKEPMQAQDEFNQILLNKEHNKTTHAFGEMATNSFFSMMDFWNLPADKGGNEMTDTWQIFGDPTVVVRTANWGNISCTHPATLPNNATTFTVNCNTDSALVCLYYKNEILATAKSIGGIATFTFAPVSTDTAQLIVTATKYNYRPYVSNISVGVNKVVKNNLQLIMYPNPATNTVNITTNNQVALQNVQIVNTVGQIVYQTNSTASFLQIPTSRFATGVYKVKVQSKHGNIIASLLVE